MYPLLACSILALTVIIERFLFWVREDLRRDQALVDNVLELCRLGKWEKVRKQVQSSRDYVVRILVAGILHREFSMGKAMETAAADEIQKMRRYLIILDTMITIAPLLGIFGTVMALSPLLSFSAPAAYRTRKPLRPESPRPSSQRHRACHRHSFRVCLQPFQCQGGKGRPRR
jgi:biopolymer transport protein ExbB/TolQ